MVIKELIDRYFANELRTVPSGAEHFFAMLDEIESLITTPGLINLDENDIANIIHPSTKIITLMAHGRGPHRAERLGHFIVAGIPDSFWDKKPTKVLFNISGGPDMTLYEVNDLAEIIYDFVDPDADIIFGAVIDENLGEYIDVTVMLGSN